jgi:hypothetical protein
MTDKTTRLYVLGMYKGKEVEFLPGYAAISMEKAEAIFGQVNPKLRYAGIGFSDTGPNLFYLSGSKCVVILINKKTAALSPSRAAYQISFLIPDLISGNGPNPRNNLVWGCGEYYGRHREPDCAPKDSGDAEKIVAMIVQKHPDIARRMLHDPSVLKRAVPEHFDFLMSEALEPEA